MSTVVGNAPTVPAASVPANVVLNAFSTRDCGSAAAISAAAEPSAGTVSESKVSKFNGLVMSTTTLPASCSPRWEMTSATAGYGMARTTISPVTGLSRSERSNSSTVSPPLVTTLAIAWAMLPVPMMLTCAMELLLG
jgi:hypothetical protein